MKEIEKTCHQQSDVNLALLKLIKQYGQACYTLLFDQFGNLERNTTAAHTRFSKKLQYLCYTDQLQRTGMGKKAVYTLGHLAFKPQPGTALAASRHCERSAAIHDPIDPADSYLVSKALPNQYDVMAAPEFTPPPATVLRPGALDYQRYASHGDRC
jgi:hypothetical protein